MSVSKVSKWAGLAGMWASAIAKEDLIFLLSLIVTVLSLVIEYLKMRKKGGNEG